MMAPVEEALKAMIGWGWSVETDPSRAAQRSQVKRKMSKMNLVGARGSIMRQRRRWRLLFGLDRFYSKETDWVWHTKRCTRSVSVKV
jgi:hypothetical protein